MASTRWLIFLPLGVLSVLTTLFFFQSTVSALSSVRYAHYYGHSPGISWANIGISLLTPLFVYGMTARQMIKEGIPYRRMVWAVLPLGALLVLLACVGTAQVKRDAKEIDLLFAAQHGNTEAVNHLLDQGTNIEARNGTGMTPLMRAAEYGQTETVKLLLARGANIQAHDILGLTAVLVAADQGQSDTLELLLERGADPNAADKDGITPLMWAAAFANHQTVQTLLKHDAKVNAQDARGKTALMMAAGDREELGSRGNAASVRVLLAAGADVRITDHHGKTALTQARKYRRLDLARMLVPGAASQPPSASEDDPNEEKSTANWP